MFLHYRFCDFTKETAHAAFYRPRLIGIGHKTFTGDPIHCVVTNVDEQCQGRMFVFVLANHVIRRVTSKRLRINGAVEDENPVALLVDNVFTNELGRE